MFILSKSNVLNKNCGSRCMITELPSSVNLTTVDRFESTCSMTGTYTFNSKASVDMVRVFDMLIQ